MHREKSATSEIRPRGRAPGQKERRNESELEKKMTKHVGAPRSAALAVALQILAPQMTRAETLDARETEYSNEVKDDDGAKACHIVLAISNLPSPEAISFRFTMIRGKDHGKYLKDGYVGFSLDVADAKFSNGAFVGVKKAQLSDASFGSNEFSSAGRLHMVAADDGGVLGFTNEPRVSSDMMRTFSGGTFEISFVRRGASIVRTYRVSGVVPGDVLAKFNDCIQTLE